MSFNIDDPLAGILSDGSDDSFFDDDIIGKKKPAKKKTPTTTPIAEKKNALFDLGDGDKFKQNKEEKKESQYDLGITAASKKPTSVLDDKSSKTDINKSPTPFKRTVSKESIKFAPEPKTIKDNKTTQDRVDILTKSSAKAKTSSDKLDFLDDLIEPRKETIKPLEKGKSSQSLLDDILGSSSNKPTSSNTPSRPATAAAKNQDFDLDTIIGNSDSKQNISLSKNALQKQSINKTEPPKENTNKKSKPTEDWLGIFQNKDMGSDDEENEDESGMPAWLVGDSKKKKATVKKTKEVPIAKEVPKAEEESLKQAPQPENHVVENDWLKVPSMPAMSGFPTMPNTATTSRVVHGSSEDNITAEGAALYLEQQESQLMLALQLKAQEEKLVAMQTRQKEAQRIQRDATQAQHAQVDAILQRQQQQRKQMQAIIAAHQERITQRIKDLLGTTNTENDEFVESNDGVYDHPESEKRESPHIKEKKQLLQLVQSLQENHDKEIDLMETSYRRQLAFLEVSVNQSEERMKEESDKIVKFYTEKLSWLEEHHQLHKKLTEENLNSLAERHKAENEMLRQQHLENIRILQEHHAALMENIKNAVKQEQVLIQDSAGFSADLYTLVNDVKENKSQCQNLVERVRELVEKTHVESDRSLQTREGQINEMIQQLKRERESFETEKVENRDVVKMLETRLKQMTTMIEDETASLKAKKMEFEFEKATFSKQTEFAKNILKKQDEEIKLLRDDIQREYKEKIAKIDEEKAKTLKDSAAIAKERVSIQNLKQELEKTKAELHAQLEEVSDDRSKLNLEKQQLHMEEQRVIAKSRDLDLLAKSAIEKQTQADQKYAEAELIQKKYEERIRRMHEHVVSLNAREKQIAKEKVALSRERLSLHNEKKQMENRQHCSLCKPSQNVPNYNFDAFTIQDTFLNMPVSRDYGTLSTNTANTANYAMNAFEQDMASHIGRNLNLRHTSGFTNMHEDRWTSNTKNSVAADIHDERDDRENVDNIFHAAQSSQTESGAFKDYMDPKFMMLRLDVQQVLSNLDQSKKDDEENVDPQSEKE